MSRSTPAATASGVCAFALFGLTVWSLFVFAPAHMVDGLGRLLTGPPHQRLGLLARLPVALVMLAGMVGALRLVTGAPLRTLAPQVARLWPLALAPVTLLIDGLGERATAMAVLVGATLFYASAPTTAVGTTHAGDSGTQPSAAPPFTIPAAALPLMAALGSLFFFVLAWQRHRAYWSSLIDLGLFYELFDNAQGTLLHSPTLCGSFLGEHMSPILVLAWPLVALTKSPVALLALQSACHGLATVLLGRVALARGVPSPLAHALAFAFLVAPHNQQALLYDFHMDLFVPPLLFGAWLAMVLGRHRLLALAVVGLFATKEDAFVDVAVLGAAAALLVDRRRTGALLIVASLAYAALVVGVLQPMFRAGHSEGCFTTMPASETYAFLGRYSHLGERFGEVIGTAVLEPFHVVRHLLDDEVRPAVVLLVAAFGGLALLARRGVIWFVPTGKLLLADPGHMTSFNFYYGAIALPFAALAAVEGARSAWAHTHARRLAAALVAGTLLLVATHPSSWFCPADVQPWWGRTAHHERIDAVVAAVPQGARVSATGYVAVHLQPGRDVRMLPYGTNDAAWVIFDRQRPAWPADLAPAMARLDALAASGAWDVEVTHAAGPVVLRRRDAPGDAEAIPWWPFRYEAEQSELSGYRNAVARDARASDGAHRSLRARDSRGPGHLLYGPYMPMPEGMWNATFALRARAERGHDPALPVATIDVWAGGHSYARRELRADELSGAHFTAITLPFTLPAMVERVETRVYWHGRGDLDVDYVEIAPRIELQ